MATQKKTEKNPQAAARSMTNYYYYCGPPYVKRLHLGSKSGKMCLFMRTSYKKLQIQMRHGGRVVWHGLAAETANKVMCRIQIGCARRNVSRINKST